MPVDVMSQTLLRYEQRMITSVINANAALARDIDERWGPQPLLMIVDQLVMWQEGLAVLLYRYVAEVTRLGVGRVAHLSSRKSTMVEAIMLRLQRELVNHTSAQAELIRLYFQNRISEALASGVPEIEVRRKIVAILSNVDYAGRIVRTELHTALERGQWEAANDLGVRVVKVWISREDDRVRPAHAAANGQVQEVGQPFTVGGESLRFPGDPQASARNRINCRCTTHYVVA